MLFKSERITRGDGVQERPYLNRLIIFTCKLYKVFLHQFVDGDDICPHCHPWWFISIILWHGYWEVVRHVSRDGTVYFSRRWYRPGSILFRRADHTHRIEIEPGSRPVTLVITGPKTRSWGFYTKLGWLPHSVYRYSKHCA